MKKIFISYANDAWKYSLKRIGQEAKALNIFDKIILYTEKDLPGFITSSPVFAFNRGGGYWVWKAYIINETLKNNNEGDIVVYADAGCTLHSSPEWDEYFNYLKHNNAIFFQYRDFDYGWSEINKCNYSKIKYWMKQSAIDYFSLFFDTNDWLEYNKICGGAIFIKKTKETTIIEEWLKIKLFKPDLLIDPFGYENILNSNDFNGHRHDQALLTPLVYFFKDKENLLVIPENSEYKSYGAIIASRKKNTKFDFVKKILSEKKYKHLKLLYNKVYHKYN